MAEKVAWAVLFACALAMLVVLSPALLICALVCDGDDPAESYRRYWWVTGNAST